MHTKIKQARALGNVRYGMMSKQSDIIFVFSYFILIKKLREFSVHIFVEPIFDKFEFEQVGVWKKSFYFPKIVLELSSDFCENSCTIEGQNRRTQCPFCMLEVRASNSAWFQCSRFTSFVSSLKLVRYVILSNRIEFWLRWTYTIKT